MKNVLKLNGTRSKKIKNSMLSVVVIISITGLLTISISTKKVRDFLKEEAKATLENVSSQNIINLRDNIETRQNVLNSIADSIEEVKDINAQDILDTLRVYENTNLFYSLGIIDENGIAHITTDKYDLSKRDYFKDAMKGIGGISNGIMSVDKKEIINIFSTPIYNEDKVNMVLTATYKSSDFSEIINTKSFNGNGKSIVIDSKGRLVTSLEKIEYTQFDEQGNIKHEILGEINKEIKESDEPIIDFKFNGESYLAYYEKVGIQDWYLVSYVPKKILYKNLTNIENIIVNSSLVTYVSIVVLLIALFVEYSKYKKKMSKIVFYDGLTEEKNYEYLKLYFEDMDEEKKKDKYLIVMDIDNFRSINIMHGSEIGDKVIKYIPSIFKEILHDDEIFKYNADIFIGIISAKSKGEVVDKINKIQSKVEDDIKNKIIVPMRLSFGVCYLKEFDDLHSIYNNALISKSSVKNNINKKISFFDEDDKNQIIENRKMESDFVDALRNNEFEVWYQPKYNAKTNKIHGAESLVRWKKSQVKLFHQQVLYLFLNRVVKL